MNLYAFALNDPFLLVDPYGLENIASEVSTYTLPSYTWNQNTGFLPSPGWDWSDYYRGPSPLMNLSYGFMQEPFFNIEDIVTGGVTSALKLGGIFFKGAGVKGMSLGMTLFSKNMISKLTEKITKVEMKSLKEIGKNISLNGPACNRALFERYKNSLRTQMAKPHASDINLQKIFNFAYRENAAIGSGSTASAIRFERATGEGIFGRFHSQKGKDLISSLNLWLVKNPTARAGDRAAAENVIIDLINSLGD